MAYSLILLAIILAAVSGIPGLLLARTSVWSQRFSLALLCTSAAAGLAGAFSSLFANPHLTFDFPWPAAGNSLVGVDPLSAFFLIPIFVTGALGSVYSLGYWPQHRHPRTGRKTLFFWGLLLAGMPLLVISKHAMAFLFGWEVMALSAFFLVTTEDHRPECRRTGWIYFIATHVSTLILFALFALWRWTTGSYALQPIAAASHLGILNILFFLALIGFGLKAGVMPLHFWLPGAHANAPSHISAMLSGIMLKMGIYGLLRFLSLLPHPPAVWGAIILALGAVSGLLGVVFALAQHDLKRFLAYHSIENIGIILMGLGLAMLGRSYGRPEWIVLGLAGCLLHVWNHSIFKSLLFMAAGSAVHATGTRQIDDFGGLAKTMPWTAAMFLIGSIAICGLPPLNGFISEWFVYLGLLQGVAAPGTGSSLTMIAAPVLAMIGALAVACFVKAYGVVFLGTPRTPAAAKAQEAPLSMRIPMLAFAGICVLLGVAPVLTGPILDAVIACWNLHLPTAPPKLASLAPLQTVGGLSTGLLVGLAALTFLAVYFGKIRRRLETWACGYTSPTSRMQYTASSFAQPIMAMFARVLRTSVQQPHIQEPFPGPALMRSHVSELTLERVLEPASHNLKQWFGWFRRFQQGLTQYYVLYILIFVSLLLATLIPVDQIITWLSAR